VISDYHQMLARLRETVAEVSPDEVSGSDAVLIDIREPHEFSAGVIPGSYLVPQGQLPAEFERVAPDRDQPVVVYCATGQRSLVAAQWLGEQGYSNVASMAGGIVAWRGMGLSVTQPEVAQSGARYARHLVLPEVGVAGQALIASARVLILGAGGLGSPAALYLAAAGVGTIGIADPDVVDITNLQRQIVHDTEHIGQRKVDSAFTTLGRLNDEVVVERHPVALHAANAIDVMSGYQVIVDGTDNFPTRYLVNDAALHLRVPVVHGSVFRWEGQATVFAPYRGPCYRCLFPEPPPPELAPNCADAGVLGVLPGVIGSIQAVEALKLILGVGSPLIGRLLTYDALDQQFSTLAFERDPACPACADDGRPPTLVDYDASCRPVG
jgi:sulfur-carrier protein adenylyltransferase/sulfurtransferase